MSLKRTPESRAADREFLQVVNSYDSYADAGRAIGLSPGYLKTKAYRARKRLEKDARTDPETRKPFTIPRPKANRFVITSALNDCPLHRPFWESLRYFIEDRGAELIVRPCRYRNPDAYHQGVKEDYTWPAEVLPYLSEQRLELNKNLVYLGDVPISATTVNPLSGLQALAGGKSAIIGHAQVMMETVPTPQQTLPKILHTTGSVSRPEYSRSKAGVKGQHHHALAAVYVETDGDTFWLRELWADNTGTFYDMDRCYTPTGVTSGHRVSALVMGDEHAAFADPEAVAATYDGPGSMCGVLRPEVIVRHDALDFYARNHHHAGNVVTNYVKHRTRFDSVVDELDKTIAYLDDTLPADAEQVIVRSNHDEALDRWLNDSDPRKDPENIQVWCRLMDAKLEAAKLTPAGVETIDAFPHYAAPRMRTADRTRFLRRDESYYIHGVELGFHGDHGPSGSRGSRKNYSKIGVKTTIAHGHSPGIYHGVFQVGVLRTLVAEYTRGPGAWMHTNCALYKNGKRSLYHIIGGRWRAEK